MDKIYEGRSVTYDSNGYPSVYWPEYQSARKNGSVHLHIIEAERMLNRQLKKGEVVHHRDENPANYNQNNLMVFRSQADHVRYHHGGRLHKDAEGIYYTDLLHVCPVCGKSVSSKAVICKTCWAKQHVHTGLSKEELEKLLAENMSFLQIGRKYGVSDTTIRKWCKRYGLRFQALASLRPEREKFVDFLRNHSIQEAVNEYSVSRNVIRKWMNEYGISLPPYGTVYCIDLHRGFDSKVQAAAEVYPDIRLRTAEDGIAEACRTSTAFEGHSWMMLR